MNDTVLVEREQSLASLTELLTDACAGQGRVVFLGGEAGVGKTSLTSMLATEVGSQVTIRRGLCDNLTTADPLGPVLEAVPEVADLVTMGTAVGRLQLFRQLREILTRGPTLLILEDIHWADEASLDLLKFLGRRIGAAPLLVVASFRNDEVGPDHPLTIVLGDLASSSASVRMQLPPLSVTGVRDLVTSAASSLDPVELHRRTGGNPFYVTEVLADSSEAVPATVRDAVLARASRLSPPARTVLSVIAALGQGAEMDLVAAVSGLPVTAIDEGLGSGVLVADGPLLSFRHELARLAVEVSTPQAEQIAWHSRALTELRRRRSRDDRRLTYHAVRCGDRAAIAEYAPRAAARAAHLGAHREAAEQYRVALQWSDAQGIDRARLLDLRAYECYLTDQTESARESRREALTLYKEAGAEREVGVTQRWLSRLSWFLGENGESERYAADAVQTLEPLGEDRELAMAYSNMAQLRMLDRDPAGAVDWGTRALTLARRVGDLDVEIHALNNVGSALSYGDDITEGGQLLNRSLTLALLEDAQEHAARAYTNLGCTAVANRDFPDGIRLLRTGIGYCADHDLDSWRLYMSAWLAWSLAEQGQYAAAEQTLSDVRRHPDLSPITRITALVVAGQLAGRRGLDGSAALDRALTLARITGEAQRLVPVAVARAEAAWLDGRMADIAPEIDHAWPAALEHPVGWELGELLWWLKVAGVNRPVPVPLPPPFARLIEGRYHEAAQEWRSRGAPMWTALALGSADELPAAREGIEILDSLGLGAVREAVLRDRHARGQVVPRGPRPSSRANPNGLTAREIEVLGLLAQGLSNADLAARLYLSEKTVGHHVSALLRKLGEPTRSKAVASALRRGIVQPK